MQTSEIKGTSVLIVGYGREGKSVHAWIKKHCPDVTVSVADKNKALAVSDCQTFLGDTYLSRLSGFDTVIRSPGVSPYIPEIATYVRDGGFITSATNIFFSVVTGTTIGITGTKGKSTTSSLIAHILSSVHTDVRLVGNIGAPMLDYVDGASPETIFVMELSSHQLEGSRYSPHVAVVLGIVPEHMDYYPDIFAYAQAKEAIVRFQNESDIVVYNPNHELVSRLVDPSRGRKVWYAQDKREGFVSYVDTGAVYVHGASVEQQIVLPVSDIPLFGNVENVLAATAACFSAGVGPSEIASAIRTFEPLPHRLEYVGEYRGVRFYNDSLATIPEATIHALTSLGPDVTTLIAGGFDRGLDFTKLGKFIPSTNVRALILFSPTGEKIRQVVTAAGAKSDVKFYACRTMEEAVKLAYEHTPRGKICVLSPASASFNLFRDYADRGEQFKSYVRELGQQS